MKDLLVFLLLSLPFPSGAIDFYCKGDTLHVLALNGLKLRQEPKGAVLATIRLGESVVVDSVPFNLPDTFDNIQGNWVLVRYKKQTGYVFSGYLTTLPPPILNDSSLSHYVNRCFKKIGKTSNKTNGGCMEQPVGEGYYYADISFFQEGNNTVKTINYGGWEWGHDTYEFDFVSLEEIWLIVKVIYRKELIDKPFDFPESVNFEKETNLVVSLVTRDYTDGYLDLSIRYTRYDDPKVTVNIASGY